MLQPGQTFSRARHRDRAVAQDRQARSAPDQGRHRGRAAGRAGRRHGQRTSACSGRPDEGPRRSADGRTAPAPARRPLPSGSQHGCIRRRQARRRRATSRQARFIDGKRAEHCSRDTERGEIFVKSRSLTLLARRFALASCRRRCPAPAGLRPKQRIDRLERQVQQVQRQVFPQGPAGRHRRLSPTIPPRPNRRSSTSTSGSMRSSGRWRTWSAQSEENGNRLREIEADLARLRADQEQRIAALEQRMSEAAAAGPATDGAAPGCRRQPKRRRRAQEPKGAIRQSRRATRRRRDRSGHRSGRRRLYAGFRLWEAGNTTRRSRRCRAFTAAYPRHRRVSYANNLIGRSLLDKGDARAAAEACSPIIAATRTASAPPTACTTLARR